MWDITDQYLETHRASAFNPGAANLQSVVNTLYVPRQYAPLNEFSQDIFEEQIKTLLGNNVEFVDTWMYHILIGEIHCGSNVKRQPITNWWEKQPQKGKQP